MPMCVCVRAFLCSSIFTSAVRIIEQKIHVHDTFFYLERNGMGQRTIAVQSKNFAPFHCIGRNFIETQVLPFMKI